MMPSTLHRLALVLLVAASVASGARDDDDDDASNGQPMPMHPLGNGGSVPLIGMGIGNLPHEKIPEVVTSQLKAGVTLVDTARASNNERILATAVSRLDGSVAGEAGDAAEGRGHTRGGSASDDGASPEEQIFEPLHVITKVWYTHLGYERTKVSVQESLDALAPASVLRPVHVHMLIHWPYCNDDIPWMHCEEEEDNLPQSVKDAGPPPHLHKETAFIDSWKALEEIYLEHQQKLMGAKMTEVMHQPLISSIGVSNFDLNEMKALMDAKPRVPPHIYQGNAWAVFHDPYLMDYLAENKIFFQAYGVMNGILQRKNEAPHAYELLTGLSHELLAKVHSQNKEVVVTEATVLLAYFVKRDVGIIPRAASGAHQRENSPEFVAAILPHLTESHIQQLEKAVPALMKGEDLHASVSFMNALAGPIQIHWLNSETNEEVLVSEIVHPGSVEIQKSHPGHRFVAYDTERSIRKEFQVSAKYGEMEYFSVEL